MQLVMGVGKIGMTFLVDVRTATCRLGRVVQVELRDLRLRCLVNNVEHPYAKNNVVDHSVGIQ